MLLSRLLAALVALVAPALAIALHSTEAAA
jgi:hypothetical protein